MRVVLHIGAHKTGTSSIQATMLHSGHVLSDLGVLYPKCCWLDSAHHRLAFAMKGKADPRQSDVPNLDVELAALTEALATSSARVALVSSEEFFTTPKPAIERLAEALDGHQPEIVAFVRRPDELLESAFNQRLKQVYRDYRREPTVGYHIEDFVENPESIVPDIDYNRFISRWIEVFGAERVKLVPYEVADAVVSMSGILGVDPERLVDATRRESPRTSKKVLAILRLARETGASAATQEAIRVIVWDRFPHQEGGGVLSARDREAILRKYKKGNEDLFRKLLGQENPYDAERLSIEDKDGLNDDTLRMRDLMKVIIGLVEEGTKSH